MRQSCYIYPVISIIELYRWKEIYLDKENLCITTGMFLTGEGGGHSMIGGSKKSNWKIYVPPSVIYLLFSYLINMEGWIYYDWYKESEIIYVTPWKLLRIFKVAKYWKELNLSQYCINAKTFHKCLTTSEFSTLD